MTYIIAFPHSLKTFETADEAHEHALAMFRQAADRIQHIDIFEVRAVGVVERPEQEKEIA